MFAPMILARRLTLILAMLWPTLARAEGPLNDARATLEKWVEARQLISKTRSDWQSDKEMLEQTCELLERELKVVEEQFQRLGTNSTQVEKERLQAEASLKSSDETLERVKQVAAGLEGQILDRAPGFPLPLQEIIKPLLNRIPSDRTNTKMAATERMQVVVGILNEVDKFNSAVTVFSEKRKDAKGEELAVDTIYVGLGAAYFVSDSGQFAGTGRPGAKGWEWTPVPAIGPAVREAIRVYRNEHPARFVALPAVIQ